MVTDTERLDWVLGVAFPRFETERNGTCFAVYWQYDESYGSSRQYVAYGASYREVIDNAMNKKGKLIE